MELVRIEPWSIKEVEHLAVYRNSLPLLQESGFLPILLMFNGFYSGVALEFARSFNGSREKVGSLDFAVIEQSISEATGVVSIGE